MGNKKLAIAGGLLATFLLGSGATALFLRNGFSDAAFPQKTVDAFKMLDTCVASRVDSMTSEEERMSQFALKDRLRKYGVSTEGLNLDSIGAFREAVAKNLIETVYQPECMKDIGLNPDTFWDEVEAVKKKYGPKALGL